MKENRLAPFPKICVTEQQGRLLLKPAPYFSTTLQGPYLEWLIHYAQGKRLPLPPFDLSFLSPFRQRVLEALMMIPPATTRPYHQLLGDRRFARAVGSACHHNPYPLFIPCHRVVAHSHLGGYRFGTLMKQALLDFEFKNFS